MSISAGRLRAAAARYDRPPASRRPSASACDYHPRVAQTQLRTSSGVAARTPPRAPRYPRHAAPPVLAEVRRGSIVESRHRGHIVQVNEAGRVERGIGDPQVVVNLRSSVKPFALIALVESGAVEAFQLSDSELAVMAASHTGEDAHVRTLQAVLRRATLSQGLLACGSEGAPQDRLTAARL